MEPTAIDGVTATYVLSLLTDDTLVWRTLTAMAVVRPLPVALTDIGPPDTAPRWQQSIWRLLARLGGARPRAPWRTLTTLAEDTTVQTAHGGPCSSITGTANAAGCTNPPLHPPLVTKLRTRLDARRRGAHRQA